MNQLKDLNIHQIISELNNIVVPIDLLIFEKNNNESIILYQIILILKKVNINWKKMENEDSYWIYQVVMIVDGNSDKYQMRNIKII